MRTLRPLSIVAAAGALGLTLGAPVQAQTFELLHSFVESMQAPNGIVEGEDGSVYGTFSFGGPGHGGGIFRRSADGTLTVEYAFDRLNPAAGFNPYGGLVRGADGAFYGTATQGGVNQRGVLFRWDGGTLTPLHQFSGGHSWTGLTLGADGFLYGLSSENCGTIFRFDPNPDTPSFDKLYAAGCGSQNVPVLYGPLVVQDGSVYGLSSLPGFGSIFRWNSGGLTTLHEFTAAEGRPARIVKGTDGAIYGGTWAESTTGILFRWSAAQFTTLHTFGRIATLALVSDVDGSLYGAAVSIDSAVPHTIFKWRGGVLTTLHEFVGPDQLRPTELVMTTSGRLAGLSDNGTGLAIPGGFFSLGKDGRDFEELLVPNDARSPSGDLVRMPDGTIYGTTLAGGRGNGTLFKRSANGTIATLHAFTYEDGLRPTGVILGADGHLYGVTEDGGNGCGTLFEWDGAAFHVQHAFDGTDGCRPAALTLGNDGKIYGMTRSSGSPFAVGAPTLFRWAAGSLEILHSFVNEGSQPPTRLAQGSDGALFGVASGGEYGLGAVFKWHNGTFTRVHSFGARPEDGLQPAGSLVLGRDGALYGGTLRGGVNNAGVLYRLSDASYTVLHSFAAGEASFVNRPLALLPDGSIVTSIVRNNSNSTDANAGSVVRWNGTALSTLHVFDLSQQTGAFPTGLIVAGDGNVYGSTLEGGSAGGGTLFRLVSNQGQAPVITSVTAPVDPTPVNTAVTVLATYTDQETSGHTCTFAWDDGTSATTVLASGGACSATHAFTAAGVYTATVTVRDASGLSDVEASPYIVIYDPSAGFVTGAGSIESAPGAYTPDATLAGRARFAFVSRNHRGATIPTGNTEFRFDVASMKFSSASYEWLVIAGARAQYKGRGTINGAGDYGFLLTATDGEMPGGGADAFRIKIWDRASGVVIYDNVAGASDALQYASPQALVTGSVVIHAR
jgi:uncharacterized repeat protein (TIGR03803 family)